MEVLAQEMKRYLTAFFTTLGIISLLSGCSMSEEMRRIDAVKRQNERAAASRSTDLTGEQVFMRSCNTCHPGGREGMGPALDKTTEHYPQDEALTAFLRKGKGTMPGNPKNTLNDQEMHNLVVHLRGLVEELNEPKK